MSDLVSLLVTTYNVQDFIERAIKSALLQTYPQIEIIIVDDCSTDKTWEKLQQFSGKAKLIRHKTRKRVSAALNTALEASRGDFITRLDGDDVIYPKMLEKEVKAIKAHPEIGFVYCDYEEINLQEEIIRQVKLPKYSPLLIHQVDYIAMGNLVRRECYEKIGNYDDTMKKQEHYDWSIRLIAHYQGLHIPRILFAYTRHPQQATAKINDLKYYTEKIRKKYNLKSNMVMKW